MFRQEKSPYPPFEGYAVRLYRQTRANLALRTLNAPVVRFRPSAGLAGLFLPRNTPNPGGEMLCLAWERAGRPPASPLKPDERQILDARFALRLHPYAGYDDHWLENGILHVACRKATNDKNVEAILAGFRRDILQERANALLQDYLPRLPGPPPESVEVKPLGRRTLGLCSRTGAISLSLCLGDYPEDLLRYVLAHELVHLAHFNHSPAFWQALTHLHPVWLHHSLAYYL